MAGLLVANAPCSWGIVEEFGAAPGAPAYGQVLDELAQAGYAGTELGEWGFLPTEPIALRSELGQRGLSLAGAYVPVALADPASHAAGETQACRAAELLAACAWPDAAPVIVLSDANGADPLRTRLAGSIRPEHGLSAAQWRDFARGAERIARAVRERTSLRTAFHHHCAGFVETPDELATLLERTDPGLLGLCLDTGHYTYGGGDALDALRRYGARIWHVHVKDCDAAMLARVRRDGLDYHRAVREGVFCHLGDGLVDIPAIVEELARRAYAGWVVVEHDVAPGTGTPLESARRDRQYLRALGL
ncbi:MAG: TIM barrel protein [Chloroflexi bacterium]|nr:TIM barrel protein [Chloroflexota bacterium]